MSKGTLEDKLDKFMQTWLLNPAGQLEFVRLIEDVHQQPRFDHADHELLEWIDRQRASLRTIGVK